MSGHAPSKVEAILNAGRMLSDGIPPSDFFEAAQMDDVSKWFDFWADKGRAYEELGDSAIAAGAAVSGGEWLWHASLSWHYGQFMWFHDVARREEGQTRKVELYKRAAPHFSPSAERIEIPIDDTVIPGYLRLPAGAGPHPCVLLIGGLESTKEESYLFEAMCLRRGLATFSFDGPGQGEMFFSVKLQKDFERYGSAIIDTLDSRPEVDSNRIGVLGRSLGGYYALRSAAADARLKSCVSWGTFLDMSDFDTMPEHTADGFVYVAGYDDKAEGRAFLQDALDLRDIIDQLNCPTYVLQGVHDPIFPQHQTDLVIEAIGAKPSVEIDVEPDGDHCCHNMGQIVRPRMVDFLVATL